MSLIKATLVMAALWGCTLYMMFWIASCEAKAVMGAPDQTPAEKRLSECQDEKACKAAYDEVWGQGAWDLMQRTMEDCSEYGNCELDSWDWDIYKDLELK